MQRCCFAGAATRTPLEPKHADKIYKVYMAFTDVPGLAHVATAEEIAGHRYNLNIPLYVPPADDRNALTLEEALTALEEAQQAARASRAALEQQLAAWGLP